MGFELARQFRHGDVVLFRQAREKKRAVRIELGVAAPADRLGDQAAPQAVSCRSFYLI